MVRLAGLLACCLVVACAAACTDQFASLGFAPVTSPAPMTLVALPADSPTPQVPGTPDPAAEQDRWLQGVPCRAPCWEGITPGTTNAVDASQALRQSRVATNVMLATSELGPKYSTITWDWATGIPGLSGGEASYDGTSADQVIQTIQLFNAAYRLEDVMRSYGEPSDVVARVLNSPDQNDPASYDINLIYRERGFLLFASGPDKPQPGPNLELRVIFFAPADEALALALGDLSQHAQWLVPWQGMQDFDFYCRDTAGKVCGP